MERESVPSGYSPRLYNEDLAPVPEEKRNWKTYNLFALWMTDVHNVGTYVFAAALFATGLTGWQVLTGMLAGILLVFLFINLMGKPSQRLGIPFPVAARMSFGVFGANLPALMRATMAIVWYGVQTYLASVSLQIVLLRFFPSLQPWATPQHGFVGLSALGWGCYLVMWGLQLLLFYKGMETVRSFIDWAGPAVYVVMFLLAIWIVSKAGLGNIGLSLTKKTLSTPEVVTGMIKVAALIVSYFSTLLLNFGDFTRYTPTARDMKRGNLLGLPINWMLFSIVTVVVTSGTTAVFGEAIMDPIEVVGRIDNSTAIALGSMTFIIAAIGVNIVANFVSAAFDLANIAPSKISFRKGGLIGGGIVLLTLPWHFYGSPTAINFFVGTIGGVLGPLYGIMVADYYLVKRQHIKRDDLYSDSRTGSYYYTGGWNLVAVGALIPSALLSMIISLVPALSFVGPFNWFVSAAAGGLLYTTLARRRLHASQHHPIVASQAGE
ncbi:NCS1 family nucleobase:cation symporter-1 [Paraburkholderia sp. J63]|uniref:NCS1 family nucleobase:cation symporter-1 n=1 Tax=Paraburkholderia sp. J63 TaxID=2805434 RepID=UPI002ABD6E66|nr:NCS1 family nucleobase:cation symporter-1 [Paraburkholderia sp. J63]